MNGQAAPIPLFGGSIKTVLPPHFLDASNFRQVPNNQEVFVSNFDETSIIFDILERVDAPDSAAAEFHFDALAADNEIDEGDDDDSRVFSTRFLTSSEHPKLPDVPACSLAGYQRIVKGHYRNAPGGGSSSTHVPSQYVVIFLVVFRLADKDTDMVVSLNYPLRKREDIEAIHEPDTRKLLRWIDEAAGVSEAEGVLREIIRNFEIVDWSLFDGEEEDQE